MNTRKLIVLAVALLALPLAGCPFTIVDTNHEAVKTLWGELDEPPIVLGAGFHLVNPMADYHHYDNNDQVFNIKDIAVPAQDQQKVSLDVDIQWRLLPGFAGTLRADTGGFDQSVDRLLWPVVRSALRDSGRGVKRVEDYFDEGTVAEYETIALAAIQEGVTDKGFEVRSVLVRDVELPEVIRTAINAKKKREQEVEQERAELARKDLEFQQQIKESEAQLAAERNRAEAIVLKGEAEAKAIRARKKELNAAYVDYVRATAWDGKLPTHVFGGDASISAFMRVE